MLNGQKIVVVMPAYNAARTLRQTYDEVMVHGIVDFVIVVDDASHDETVVPLTMSDSGGLIYDKNGIDEEKLAWVKSIKNVRRGRISEYAKKFPLSVVGPAYERAGIIIGGAL
jgi:glutamate dehydrogenase/leucine dehydrogenase